MICNVPLALYPSSRSRISGAIRCRCGSQYFFRWRRNLCCCAAGSSSQTSFEMGRKLSTMARQHRSAWRAVSMWARTSCINNRRLPRFRRTGGVRDWNLHVMDLRQNPPAGQHVYLTSHFLTVQREHGIHRREAGSQKQDSLDPQSAHVAHPATRARVASDLHFQS